MNIKLVENNPTYPFVNGFGAAKHKKVSGSLRGAIRSRSNRASEGYLGLKFMITAVPGTGQAVPANSRVLFGGNAPAGSRIRNLRAPHAALCSGRLNEPTIKDAKTRVSALQSLYNSAETHVEVSAGKSTPCKLQYRPFPGQSRIGRSHLNYLHAASCRNV